MKIFASVRPDEVQKLERHPKKLLKIFFKDYFLRTSAKIVIRSKVFIFGMNANDIDLIALFINLSCIFIFT